jgi:hypothetical protein
MIKKCFSNLLFDIIPISIASIQLSFSSIVLVGASISIPLIQSPYIISGKLKSKILSPDRRQE